MTDKRILTGTAARIAQQLQVQPEIVRSGFVVGTLAYGIGGVAYLLFWLRDVFKYSDPQPTVNFVSKRRSLGFALIVFGIAALARSFGIWFDDVVAAPVVVGCTAWCIFGIRAESNGLLAVMAQVMIGALLLGSSVVIATQQIQSTSLFKVFGPTVLAVAGAALLVGRITTRVTARADQERRKRIRIEERADIAAHLHDSVLQSLSLIQKAGHVMDAKHLARRQERELRAWLYGNRAPGDLATLSSAVDQLSIELEQLHGVSVDAIVVGDYRPSDVRTALLGAIREAVANAALHSGANLISVFVEATPAGVKAWVRDRGVGFDALNIDDSRKGITESIKARAVRYGGTVTIKSVADRGTEVEISFPKSA